MPERIAMSLHESFDGKTVAVSRHDEDVVAPEVHPVGELGEDISMAPRALGDEYVRRALVLLETDQIKESTARGEPPHPDVPLDLVRIGPKDVMVLPIARAFHGRGSHRPGGSMPHLFASLHAGHFSSLFVSQRSVRRASSFESTSLSGHAWPLACAEDERAEEFINLRRNSLLHRQAVLPYHIEDDRRVV